jgi:DNA replication licensing factor MCM3
MEQQTVTIAKAGIHASLNARCSVLSAANPVYGQYDRTRRPQENIGLPDSLLSRFDLLFIVLDQLDPAMDRTLSEHVIRSHQYRRPGTIMEPEPLNQSSSLSLDDSSEAVQDTPVWQRGGKSAAAEPARGDGRLGDLLTKEFLRKYIHYAKSRIHPVLSDDAMESISTAYAGMRAKQSQKNLPITARSLETIIRLSSASAKARLSTSVEEQDVEVAIELMNFVLFHEQNGNSAESGGQRLGGARRMRQEATQDDGAAMDADDVNTSGEFDDGLDDDEEEGDYPRNKKRQKLPNRPIANDGDDVPLAGLRDLPAETQTMIRKRLIDTLNSLGEEVGVGEVVALRDVVKRFNAAASSTAAGAGDLVSCSTAEIEQMLAQLEKENRVSIVTVYTLSGFVAHCNCTI